MKINYALQKAAANFRMRHGIGPSEPVRMKSWLPKLGVMAVFKPMSDNFSGMAIKHGSYNFILINSNHRISKQHFTIAHELYHLFEQKEFTSEISNTGRFDKKDKNEFAADWFAAYLLLPDEGLFALIPEAELAKNKITLTTIIQIEQYFACSRMALLLRLDGMELIDFNRYEAYTRGVKHSAELHGYDTTLYEPGNAGLVIGDYGARSKKLFDNGIISESHFVDLMHAIGKDIENLANDNDQEE